VRARGARVRDHYEGDIDIVAAPLLPDDDPVLPVALNSDGTQQFLQLSVRERSRLRPQFLERLGWRPLTLWTIEVFTDPDRCADLIGGYLGLKEPVKTESSRERAGRHDSAAPRADRPGAEAAPSESESAAQSAEVQPAAMQHAAEEPSAVVQAAPPASEAGPAAVGGAGAGAVPAVVGQAPAGAAPEAPAGQDKGRRSKQSAYAASAIPTVAAEDDPRAWGDTGEDRDAWLKEQRPPHWG
jgi:hypothetical protein